MSNYEFFNNHQITEEYDLYYYLDKELYCQKIEPVSTNKRHHFLDNCKNPLLTNKVIKINDVKYITFASSLDKEFQDILISRKGKTIKCTILSYSNNVFKLFTSKRKTKSVSANKIDKIFFNCSNADMKKPIKITDNWFEMPANNSVYSSGTIKSLNRKLKERDITGKIVKLSFNKVQRVNSEQLVCCISTEREGKGLNRAQNRARSGRRADRKLNIRKKDRNNYQQNHKFTGYTKVQLDCNVLFPKEVLKSKIKVNNYSTSFKNANNNIYLLVLQTNILIALGNIETSTGFSWE